MNFLFFILLFTKFNGADLRDISKLSVSSNSYNFLIPASKLSILIKINKAILIKLKDNIYSLPDKLRRRFEIKQIESLEQENYTSKIYLMSYEELICITKKNNQINISYARNYDNLMFCKNYEISILSQTEGQLTPDDFENIILSIKEQNISDMFKQVVVNQLRNYLNIHE